MPLDRARLADWKNLDPEILRIFDTWDPGNAYGVPYMWGSVGIAYNMEMVRERLPDADLSSLDVLMKPENAEKLADCGISMLDSPQDIIPMVLAYLGKDGRAANPADYPAAVEALQQVRPFFATFDNTNYINALPNGELCAVASWSGDYATAAARAEEAGVEIDLEYFVPATGAPAWADCMAIPADAPHPENAHAFLAYLLEPEVIAACTNWVNYANGNAASKPFVDPEILGEPVDLSRRGDGEADVGAAGLDAGAGPRHGAGLDRGPDAAERAVPDDPGGFAPGFVRVEAVSKRFGGFAAVDDVSLEIGKGELFALLGGSGCGKTTLLRMLAGFETPSAGRIFIDGQDMTEVPAYARPVNMMFQSYALFPHMTVEQNVGYGLTNEAMSAAQRRDRVREMLDLVKLGGLGGRKPHQNLRRPAPARRARPRARQGAEAAAPRRAARRARQEAARAHPVRARRHPVPHRRHLRRRHPRPGGGDDARQPHRRHGPRPHPPGRHARPRSTNTRRPASSPTSSARSTCSRARRRRRRVTRPRRPARARHRRGPRASPAWRPGRRSPWRSAPRRSRSAASARTAANAAEGVVEDLGYFGKDSLYRVRLASGRILSVLATNARRVGENERVAQWEDRVWLAFDPSAAILLPEERDA